MSRRNVFEELVAGVEDLAAQRQGKITLRTTTIDAPPRLQMSPRDIVELRERLGYSQPVFARLLRTRTATLRNWEQGRVAPNEQAKVLLKLVERSPRVIAELADLT